jgi:hypothetical protein
MSGLLNKKVLKISYNLNLVSLYRAKKNVPITSFGII